MKLLSWNVNGLRAVLNKGLLDYIREQDADVYCFQETKAGPDQVDPLFWPPAGYEAYWNSAQKKGYSGTLTLTKKRPLSVSLGFGIDAHDAEGRVLTTEFEDFYLVNVYTPNSQDGLRRLQYRQAEWDVLFLKHICELRKIKPVVACGDFNVAHREIDIARPKENQRSPGFTIEERTGFDNIVAAGFIDTFREFCTEPDNYTWWSMRTRARERNIGWRIDYFIISPELRPRLKRAWILCDVMGSDHCPVGIELE